jgi:hypothetical protein
MTDLPLDSRLRSKLYRGLGFDTFPFHAYDEFGDIVVPDDVHFPPEQQAQLDQTLAAPQWKQIFRILTTLQTPEWACYSAALRFLGKDVELVVAKSIDSVPGGIKAAEWCESLGLTLLKSIQEWAGSQWTIDHGVLNGLIAVLNVIKGHMSGGGGSTPTGSVESGGTGNPPKGSTELLIDRGDIGLFSPVMALELLVSLDKFALSFQKQRNVTAAVIWYVPENWGSESTDEILKNWRAVGKAPETWDKSRRVSSCLWNPEFNQLQGWEDAGHWTSGHPAMQIDPERMRRTLYPYRG